MWGGALQFIIYDESRHITKLVLLKRRGYWETLQTKLYLTNIFLSADSICIRDLSERLGGKKFVYKKIIVFGHTKFEDGYIFIQEVPRKSS